MSKVVKVNLNTTATIPPANLKKEDIKPLTQKYIQEIEELQNKLYAQQKYSLLIVLQGLDASGKDGVIKNVFGNINPQGVQVQSFKKPTELELAHDFLWRIHQNTPQKGMIQIFNRSHYEDVLITRVEKWIDEPTANKRFKIINAFEELLAERNTITLKFYLHISPEAQQERFYERLIDPAKQWKYSPDDLLKSKQWNEYRTVYQSVIDNCNTATAPWVIVPADKNWYKEYIIAKTVLETLQNLPLQYPQPKIDFSLPEVQKLLEGFKPKTEAEEKQPKKDKKKK